LAGCIKKEKGKSNVKKLPRFKRRYGRKRTPLIPGSKEWKTGKPANAHYGVFMKMLLFRKKPFGRP